MSDHIVQVCKYTFIVCANNIATCICWYVPLTAKSLAHYWVNVIVYVMFICGDII